MQVDWHATSLAAAKLVSERPLSKIYLNCRLNKIRSIFLKSTIYVWLIVYSLIHLTVNLVGVCPKFIWINLFFSKLCSVSSLLRNIDSARSIFKGLNDILEPVPASGKIVLGEFCCKG